MHSYSLFGFVVLSEIELPHLPLAEGTPDVRIRFGAVDRTDRRNTTQRELTVFRNWGAISVTGGTEIVFDIEPEADLEIARVFLLGRLAAQLMRQRGWFPLHASAVQVDNRAALFLAASGTGKSTIAAAFHARGYHVLSDDVSPVRVASGACLVRQGTARLRLHQDSAAIFENLDPGATFQFDKHVFNLGPVPIAHHAPVHRIYALEDGDDTRIEDVALVSAVRLLGRECFVRLRMAGPDLLAAHLRATAELAELMLVRRLIRPRRMDALDEVASLVKNDFSQA